MSIPLTTQEDTSAIEKETTETTCPYREELSDSHATDGDEAKPVKKRRKRRRQKHKQARSGSPLDYGLKRDAPDTTVPTPPNSQETRPGGPERTNGGALTKVVPRMHTGEQTPRGDAVVPQRVDEAVQTEVGMLETEEQDDVGSVVPTVRVCLLQTVWVPPQQCVVTRVTSNSKPLADLLVFEPNEEVQQECGILMEDSLLHPSEDGTIQVTLTNPTGITQVMEAGEMMGHVTEAMVVCAEEEEISPVRIMSARRDTEWACARERSRQLKLREIIGDLELPPAEQDRFSLAITMLSVWKKENEERRTSSAWR